MGKEEELLLFKTKTCPNCSVARNMLDAAGVSYKVLDAGEVPDLVEKYGVMQAPTLVAKDAHGVNMYGGIPNIIQWLKERSA